jgi:hypothetical protein
MEKKVLLCSIIGIVSIGLVFSLLMGKKENYRNLNSSGIIKTSSQYPSTYGSVLVQDTYPITHKYGVMDVTSSDVWKQYPAFEVGSYEQVTNNIKNPKTVDVGNCMPVEFCNTLYESH